MTKMRLKANKARIVQEATGVCKPEQLRRFRACRKAWTVNISQYL